MFYARYVLRELSRRRVRTLLTVAGLGLGLGVALVITISGLSRGLDRAQKTALDPLSGIVVATHDATLAARAPRRVAMRDGAVVQREMAR